MDVLIDQVMSGSLHLERGLQLTEGSGRSRRKPCECGLGRLVQWISRGASPAILWECSVDHVNGIGKLALAQFP